MALTLQDAIARVPQWVNAKDLRYSPLSGGITNTNYRIDVGGDAFVLRMPGNNTDLLGINRENEYLANKAAGDAGIAPQVFYFIQPEGYLVTRFIEAQPLSPEELRTPPRIRQIATLLQKIHQLPALPSTFLVERVVADYSVIARQHQVAFPEQFNWLLARLADAVDAFRHDPLPLVPCHNDLLNENFLCRGEQVLILDWEYAGMGDRYFDLANLSVNHNFSNEEDRLLLEAYFGAVTEVNWARLKTMKILSDFRESMWGLVQTGISSLDFDYRAYADKHFARMIKNIKDPRWGQWLSTIRDANK